MITKKYIVFTFATLKQQSSEIASTQMENLISISREPKNQELIMVLVENDPQPVRLLKMSIHLQEKQTVRPL